MRRGRDCVTIRVILQLGQLGTVRDSRRTTCATKRLIHSSIRAFVTVLRRFRWLASDNILLFQIARVLHFLRLNLQIPYRFCPSTHLFMRIHCRNARHRRSNHYNATSSLVKFKCLVIVDIFMLMLLLLQMLADNILYLLALYQLS